MVARLLLVVLLALFKWPSASSAGKYFRLDAHVVHGTNMFNGQPVADFSASSNRHGGSFHEVGVLNPGGANASTISAATPPTATLATLDAWATRQALGGIAPGAGPFNVPLARTPTLKFTSSSVNDREVPRPFAESDAVDVNLGTYLSAGAHDPITLAKWNRAAARMDCWCRGRRDGSSREAFFRVSMRRALPNALYTLWDLTSRWPKTAEEMPSFSSFGGVPSVLATDDRGRASITRRLKYCPFDKCVGAERCSVFILVFYHFDHVVYGGAPALDFIGPATGNVAASHMMFVLNGKPMFPPQNKFYSFPWSRFR